MSQPHLHKSRSRLLGQRGMSLVEIMVVIAIIGLLMTVIAVNVTGFLDDANVSATKISITNVEKGLVGYSLKHRGKYPSSGEGLDAAKKYYPNQETPTDAWDQPFKYVSPGGNRSGNDGAQREYEITSYGKDGKEGGLDENADIHSWDMKN